MYFIAILGGNGQRNNVDCNDLRFYYFHIFLLSWKLTFIFESHGGNESEKWNSRELNLKKKRRCMTKCRTAKSGDAGFRSPYLSHAKRALYQVSYIPVMIIQPFFYYYIHS